MKNNVTKEIEIERKRRNRMPAEIKEKMNKDVFRNLVFGVCILLYFILLNLGFFKLEKDMYIKDTMIFSIATLLVSIVFFEKAFKTDKGYYAINGIEIFTVSIFAYFVPYTYFYLSNMIRKLLMLIPLIYAIYYSCKGIGICIRAKMKYNKTDIKEIIKKEENKQDDNITIDKDKEAEEKYQMSEKKEIQHRKAKKLEEPKIEENKHKKVGTKKSTTSTIKKEEIEPENIKTKSTRTKKATAKISMPAEEEGLTKKKSTTRTTKTSDTAKEPKTTKTAKITKTTKTTKATETTKAAKTTETTKAAKTTKTTKTPKTAKAQKETKVKATKEIKAKDTKEVKPRKTRTTKKGVED